MHNKTNRIKILLICVFIAIFVAFFPIIESRSFEDNDITLNANVNFIFQEEAVKKGYLTENISIKVDLPSETWNIQDMELNFTQIDFEPEIGIIENNTIHNTLNRVYNKNPAQYIFGQAVQLEINDPSLIYGVYIYGYNYLSHPGTPQIQLRGFDPIYNRPNATVYRSVSLNLSSIPNWYLQEFNVPILLNPGNYSLVLNGTGIPAFAVTDAGFYWGYNSIDPIYPSLYVSEYIDDWSVGTSGEPFLYKVIQKLNTTIYPEEINMTAELDGQFYPVLNGNGHGNGYLKRNQLNYHANNQEVTIKIKNNKTRALRFDIDYNFNIYNLLNSTGIATIKYNDTIKWSISPEINRHSNNDTLRFRYPDNWENIQIYKDSVNISDEVFLDRTNHMIIIENNTIDSYSDWEISGSSPNIAFELNTPRLEFKTGQELSFSLGTEPLPGIYTLRLFDPLGLLKFQIEKQIPFEDSVFSYNIPKSAVEGEYTAFIFWSNGTYAGVQSVSFSIIYNGIIPQEFDFSLLIFIGIIIIASVAAVSTGYITTKKIKSSKREKLNRILERCNDIMNLKYIIVLDPK
ncbi:MAG: hypothetical protein ACFFD1_07010, partial [Candidatus Thorarchaeota archaeon]